MKKFTAVLMIALLAVTSVFAGITGYYETKIVADLDSNFYGFKNGTSTGLYLTFDSKSGESANEGDIYAKVAGHLTFNPFGWSDDDGFDLGADSIVDRFEITEASINGENWSVNVMGPTGVKNFATDWDAKFYAPANDAANPNLTQSVWKKANGVTVKVFDYAVGLGGQFAEDGNNGVLALTTPEYALVEGLTLQASAGAGHKDGSGITNVGWGAKVAYADEALSASLATDMVLDIIKDADPEFNADVAAAFTYAPVSVDVYYATDATASKGWWGGKLTYDNLLDVKVAADLTEWVPLTLTVKGLDLVNDARALGFAVSSDFIENASVSADATVALDGSNWNGKIKGSYTIDQIGKLYAQVNMGGVKDAAFNKLGLKLGISNNTIISGATLTAEYAAKNYLAEEPTIGAFSASVKMAF